MSRSRVVAVALLLVTLLGGHALGAGPTDHTERDISNLPGPQTNGTITVDPRNADVLLAGSNSLLEGAERVYSSTDGGLTWDTTTLTSPVADITSECPSDPGVAIDGSGRQYYSFDRSIPCTGDAPSRVYVATRSSPAASWSAPVLVAPLGRARVDDKPAIAVDASPTSPHRGRVYVAWARLSRRVVYSIVLSHSDDHGRTWSRPAKVNRAGDDLNYATLAVARNGTVYVAWTDSLRYSVQIARSTDGGIHFSPEAKAAAFIVISIPQCGIGIVVRAEPRACIQPDPTVTVDASGGPFSGRVYVSYTATDYSGDKGAALTTFDSRLRPLAGLPLVGAHRIVARAAGAPKSDQFWAQSAVDQSNGAVWLCFYDTAGDPAGTKVHYSCSVSRDGGAHWTRPVRAATAPSDESQLGGRQYGYYQGIAVANGVAHPIWTDARDIPTLGEEIYTSRLTQADFRR
jgi:hypothetical protein